MGRPPAILVSGQDASIFDRVDDLLRNQVLKREAVDITVLTGEQEDGALLLKEIFNLPLFSPYRLFLVKDAKPSFEYILSKERAAEHRNLNNIADRTMLAFYFEGEPTKAMLSVFGENLIHLHTKPLYSDSMEQAIRRTAAELSVNLTEEAVAEIRERVAAKEGAIFDALHQLKSAQPGKAATGIETVRDVLFPKAGFDMFRLIDACFMGDVYTFSREIMKYNPPDDTLLALLRLLLNRTDELRKYRISQSLNLSTDETINLVGLKNRHPFIQKKTLKRLSEEANRFHSDRLRRIYEMLVETSSSFRLTVPMHEQSMFFQTKMIEIFFQPAKEQIR